MIIKFHRLERTASPLKRTGCSVQAEYAYKALQDKIESLYQQYPKVLEVFDTEQAAELTKEECAALIKIMELTNQLTDMELQSIYFRGCYDSVGYLKKAGIL